MELFPAIDLFGGKAVRLLKGDYRRMTVFSESPLDVARDFVSCGAKNVHLVDLEGARDGGTPNLRIVEKIAAATPLAIEVGGGIRGEESVRRYLDSGVSRVILGTAAVTEPAFLERMVARHGGKIAVSVDVRDGWVATHGWTRQSEMACGAFVGRLCEMGVETVICTDISRDGAMRGTNRALYRELNGQFAVRLIASGGVSTMEDIRALREMGLYGAIVGKAYYTGAMDLKEALEVAK